MKIETKDTSQRTIYFQLLDDEPKVNKLIHYLTQQPACQEIETTVTTVTGHPMTFWTSRTVLHELIKTANRFTRPRRTT